MDVKVRVEYFGLLWRPWTLINWKEATICDICETFPSDTCIENSNLIDKKLNQRQNTFVES